MQPKTSFSLAVLLTFYLVNLAVGVLSADTYTRDDFPPDFMFGSGTSAYQVEGAANEDGRTPGIWDTFAHAGYKHGENGDVASDGYHKYKEDVRLMVETGLDAYRFSISWSRLIPNGRGPINPKGLQYYNNLISNGIQPHVTLHHYDLPQALEDEYGGWVSHDIIGDFTNYADVCFREFGDRVLYWTTLNEPNVFAVGGYDQDKQHGFVGINIFTYRFLPLTNTEKDRAASQRAHDFYVGWIMEPLVYGDYPICMKKIAGARIPAFTNRESKHVKGSYDFISLNFYNNINVTDNSDTLERNLRDYNLDMAVQLNHGHDMFSKEEFPVTPWGLREEMDKFKLLYGNPPLFIYENGQQTASNSSLQDVSRVKYMHGYIGAMLDALRNGSNAKGYFVWSFLDVFELLDGYKSSFGLYYVDRNDPDLKRYPKLSAKWYSWFLRGKSTSRI